MSKIISVKVIVAFLNGSKLKIDNTSTNGKELFLFNNRIAYHKPDGDIIISMCGYNTSTTRERLNELLSQLDKGHITSKNSTPYFIHESILQPKNYIEVELDPHTEYSLNTLIKYEVEKLENEKEWKRLRQKVSLPTKTENNIGKKVKCWHCGSDQKIQSIDHTFDCSNCNEPLWTGEGGFEIVI